MKSKVHKKQLYLEWLVILFIIILINILSAHYFLRIDLTEEKRYTLHKTTKSILNNLTEPVLIKVYLHGDIPIGFKKFEQSIREILDEFRVYAGNKIQYEFIDIYENTTQKQIETIIEQLYKKGLIPTNVKIKDKKGGYIEKIVVPAAIISYGNIDFPVNLLSNNPALSGEENLNHSVQNLEFNFINAIYSITKTNVKKIAFIEGHDEWDEYQTGDIMRALSNYFQVDRGQINGHVEALNPYACIIVAGPKKSMSEEDKYVIDQYIMKGGKVLWLIDAVYVNRDSFELGNVYVSIAQLNLEDQLFKYGIRINPVLIQDLQCAIIPVYNTLPGGQSKYIPTPWTYFPLLNGNAQHPISRNLNLIYSEFCNYIDTLQIDSVKYTTLLNTSQYTKIKNVPSFVQLSEVKQKNPIQQFNKQHLPVAVLAEGIFPSVFQNRLLSVLKLKGHSSFIPISKPTKMIFIADADIVRNDVRYTPNGILISSLGVDRYTAQRFGNKDFILNALQYLTDDFNIIQLRSKNIQLRLLDKQKLQSHLLFWQIINTIGPLLLVILGGVITYFLRKYSYR